MLLLRISLCLLFGLGINIAAASEIHINTPVSVYSQSEQPIQLAAKLDSRRRGNCSTSPDVWTINLCEPPPSFCYFVSEQVKLWLPEKQRSKRMDKLEIKKSGSKPSETVIKRWSASQKVLDWPKMIPIESDAVYNLMLDKSDSEKVIKMRKIQYNPNTDSRAKLLKLLNEKGCVSQVKMLESEQS